MSRIPHSFQVELALRTLFEKPTVEELAAAITEKQTERVQKEQQVSSLLAELESLSEEETQRQLLLEEKWAIPLFFVSQSGCPRERVPILPA